MTTLCITQIERTRVEIDPAFLAACINIGTLMACSRYCPSLCPGHPTCVPCYDMAAQHGLQPRIA